MRHDLNVQEIVLLNIDFFKKSHVSLLCSRFCYCGESPGADQNSNAVSQAVLQAAVPVCQHQSGCRWMVVPVGGLDFYCSEGCTFLR